MDRHPKKAVPSASGTTKVSKPVKPKPSRIPRPSGAACCSPTVNTSLSKRHPEKIRSGNTTDDRRTSVVGIRAEHVSFHGGQETTNMDGHTYQFIRRDEDIFQVTQACEAAQECLRTYGHVTLIGDAGCGKTSTALHLLRSNRSKYHILLLENPESYIRHHIVSRPTIVFIDEVFGKFTFSQQNLIHWQTCLERIASSVRIHSFCVILACRKYIFKEALEYSRCFQNNLFDENTVIDLSGDMGLVSAEKNKILQVHLGKYGVKLGDDDIKDIVNTSIPYGFPHACFLFSHMKFNGKPAHFFERPQALLIDTLKHFRKSDNDKFAMLVLILIKGGHVNLATMNQNDALHVQMFAETRNNVSFLSKRHEISYPLIDCYLKSECDTISFSHSTIEEVVMYTVSEADPRFAMENCPMHLLIDKIRISQSPKDTKGNPQTLQIFLSESYELVLIERFISEIRDKKLFLVSIHQACSVDRFVSNLIKQLKDLEMIPCLKPKKNVFHAIDSQYGETFIHWSLYNENAVLFRHILRETTLHPNERRDAIITCCICGNAQALKALLSQMETRNIQQLKYITVRKSAYTVSAAIFGNKPQRERVTNESLLHVACRYGHRQVVETLLTQGLSVNCKGESPLHVCCEKGHIGLLQDLLERGSKIEAHCQELGTPLSVACHHGHSKVVESLLEKSANLEAKNRAGLTPLLEASRRGHEDIVNVLLKKKANPTTVDNEKRSLLFHACEGLCLKTAKTIVDSVDGNLSEFRSSENETPLHSLMKAQPNMPDFVESMMDIMDILIDKGVELDIQDKTGKTALLVAAENGHDEAVAELTARDVDVNVTDVNEETLLHKACAGGAIETAMEVLRRDKSMVDIKNKRHMTPLHMATKNGRSRIVEILLENKANVFAKDQDAMSPLHYAANSGDKDSVCLLLKNGAKVNNTNEKKQTPLHLATASGLPAVHALLESDADVDAEDENHCTPLMIAAERGGPETIKTLLNYNANISAIDSQRRTSLHIAAEVGNIESAKLLYSRKNDMLRDLDKCGRTPLHLASMKGRTDTMLMLLGNNADVNATDLDKFTPLHLAARTGETETVHALLINQATVNACNKNKHTPLHLAAQGNFADTIRVLIDHDANVNAGSEGNEDTPLHFASASGGPDSVNMLLENGAKNSVNAINKTRETPLHRAAKRGHRESIKLLIENGADVNICDSTRRTPKQSAIYHGTAEAFTWAESGFSGKNKG